MTTATDGTAPQQESPVGREYTEFELAVLSVLPSDIDPDIADGWCKNLDALAKALREALLPPKKQSVLDFIDEITLPARTDQFVPRTKYIVNTESGAHVKIVFIDEKFIKWFGDKVEEPVPETIIRRCALHYPLEDIKAMRNEVELITETTPGQLFYMLEQQSDDRSTKSKTATLLTNGYANLFKMIDVNGIARLVVVFWNLIDGWYISAEDIASLYCQRGAGCRLLFSGSAPNTVA